MSDITFNVDGSSELHWREDFKPPEDFSAWMHDIIPLLGELSENYRNSFNCQDTNILNKFN